MRPFITDPRAERVIEKSQIAQEKIDQDEAINKAIILTNNATILDK